MLTFDTFIQFTVGCLQTSMAGDFSSDHLGYQVEV